MIIGIDGNEANVEKKVGVHQMAYEILWELYKLEDNNVKYIIYLKSPPRNDLPKENRYWEYKIIPGRGFWVLTKLTAELWSARRPDVFLTPSHYLPIFAPMPKVCIITDLGYLKFTGQFKKIDYWQLKLWTAISIMVSKYIIAISETTKSDIVRHYRFASEKISVVYLGANKIVTKAKLNNNFVRQILKKYRITKKYILFISTLKPGKNIEGLIEAYSRLKEREKYQLIISGKKGWLFETIFEKVKQLGLTRDVIFTDYLAEEEKPVLLSRAEVFVLPSFWEGFGIDVLNAFSVGIPVVISDIASLREVAGKAGTYVDPYDVDSIKNGIEGVINLSPKEYNKQKDKGYKQLARFSWEKSAVKTFGILKKAYDTR